MIQTAGATGNKTGTIAANDDWVTIVAALAPEPIAASSSANATYTYDANGNMTSDGVKCYQFNEANQLDKVTNCSSQTIAEYVYDYNGLRMVKRNFTNGTLANTVTSWSDSYETKVIVGGATENTSYYFANGQLIAKKDNSGTRTYFHNDHLGSTSVVTNSSGSLVETTQYDPWGKVNIGGTASKFLYTGQERDGETGLHYYNARYYNPDIRRFTQPDDIIQDIYNPQGLNRYSYVWNNPLRYTDPTGHINEILAYNNALNNYSKNPSATTYNTVLNTASSIQKQSGSSGSSAPRGGGSNSSGGGSGSRGSSNNGSSGHVSNPPSKAGASSSPASVQTNMVKGASTSRTNIGALGVCGTANFGVAAFGTGSGCIVATKREIGGTFSLGGGASTGFATGVGVYGLVSSAKNVEQMKGQDIFVGGSAWAVGVDGSWDRDNPNIKTYTGGFSWGPDYSPEFGPAALFELHGGSTKTWGGTLFKY